ncbi:MAG: extensin family protein [Sphingobium sp.]
MPTASGQSREWRGRAAALLVLTLLLAACGGEMVPRGRTLSTPTPRAAPALQQADLRQCMAKLASQAVAFSPLPDQRFGGGCSALGSVKLLDIGVPATNLGAMTCGLAANFAAWARFGVQPAARLVLGTEVVRIETFGTYSCRPIAGSSKLSEHAHSNAVDVAAFVLADGRRISVEQGWHGDGTTRRFLQIVRASACKRFNTVLSPDYNAAHYNHLHFDMGNGGGFCR